MKETEKNEGVMTENEKNDGFMTEDEMLWWYIEDALSPTLCDSMIEGFEKFASEKALVGSSDPGNPVLDLSIRDVNKLNLPFATGIGATLAGTGLYMNSVAWKFDITAQNQTEYLRYDKNGHYRDHIDLRFTPGSLIRKLTVLAFLNDDFEGGQLYLKVGEKKTYPHQKKGTVIAFPSFVMHGVEPVISGVRRSIVTWLTGPWLK